MATAETTYVDPSALLKLYLNEPQSRVMAAWRGKTRGRLPVTHHGRVEVVNGLALAAHRGWVGEPVYAAALAAFDEDFQLGRYHPVDVLWRAALKRAGELSRRHSRVLGTRSLDVIHVACALELGLPGFLTFDVRQAKLACAVGLKAIAP